MEYWPFIGVIQGLSEKKIDEIMRLHRIQNNDFKIHKLSIFRTSKNILSRISSQYLEDKYDEDDLKESTEISGIFELFRGLEGAGDSEASLIALLIILVIIVLTILWVFLIIPILILVISLITFGEAWNKFRVCLIEIYPRNNIDFKGIFRDVYNNGGTVSKNWNDLINEKNLIEIANRARSNYMWFMRGVSIISYSLFILIFSISVEYSLDFLYNIHSEIFVTLMIFICSSIVFIGFIISIYSLIQQRKRVII